MITACRLGAAAVAVVLAGAPLAGRRDRRTDKRQVRGLKAELKGYVGKSGTALRAGLYVSHCARQLQGALAMGHWRVLPVNEDVGEGKVRLAQPPVGYTHGFGAGMASLADGANLPCQGRLQVPLSAGDEVKVRGTDAWADSSGVLRAELDVTTIERVQQEHGTILGTTVSTVDYGYANLIFALPAGGPQSLAATIGKWLDFSKRQQ